MLDFSSAVLFFAYPIAPLPTKPTVAPLKRDLREREEFSFEEMENF